MSKVVESLKKEYRKLDKQTNKIISDQDCYKSNIRESNRIRMEEIQMILEDQYGEQIEPYFDLEHQID